MRLILALATSAGVAVAAVAIANRIGALRKIIGTDLAPTPPG